MNDQRRQTHPICGAGEKSLRKWQLAAIDAGAKTADAGLVVAHGEVIAWVKSWGSTDELVMPQTRIR